METGEPAGDIHAPCRERIAALEAIVAAQQKIIEHLQQKVEELEARLNQNSQNSSKPPSSDPPSTPPRISKPPSGRKPGGQPGHEGHHRSLLPPDQVNEVIEIKPDRCERCRKPLKGEDPDPGRHPVTELPELAARTTEYRRHRLSCGGCGHATLAALPEGVSEGAFGPRVQAILAYLTGQAHLSKRQIEEILSDIFGVSISLGSVVAVQQAVSEAVAAPVEEVKAYVERQPIAHADETGWKEGNAAPGQRQKAWLWVAVTRWVTVFVIHASRGTEGARALLGRFAGYLITDRWNAYNAWAVRMRQLCWAHLIRDFAGFTERGKRSAPIGEALLREAQKMFSLWHRVRDGTLARSTFRIYLSPIRRRVEALLRTGTCCGEPKTEGMCKKMLKFAPALWTFARIEGVEPTNNAAERAVRPAVLYRKGCFGTQSAAGSRFVERLLTVVATLRQQGRNVMDYLTQACIRAQAGRPAPSLLPRSSQAAAA